MKIPKQNLLELEEYSKLCDQIVCVLQKMKEVGQPLSARIVQPIFKGIIQSNVLQLIRPRRGGVLCHKRVVKIIHETIHVLNLQNGNHYCKQTPTILVYRVAYLTKSYSIPLVLVVNNDQIRIHLVSNGNKKTWEQKEPNMCKCQVWKTRGK